MLNADGSIRFASESSARLFGYLLEERLGHSAFELMHPDDVAPTRALFDDCLQRPGVPVQAEYRIQHRDGTWRHVESVAVNRLDDPAVDAIVVNYRDVTDRRLAEQALRASEERLRHIVEHAQDLIYYCDAEGRFTYVNPTAARILQYDAPRADRPAFPDADPERLSESGRRSLPAPDGGTDADDLLRVSVGDQGRRLDLDRPARSTRLRQRPGDGGARDCARHLAAEGRGRSAAQVRSAVPLAGAGRRVRHLPHHGRRARFSTPTRRSPRCSDTRSTSCARSTWPRSTSRRPSAAP